MTPKPITRNTLFYGDNLNILRDHIPSESVDLIYLDPPFNSNRSYNVLFKNEGGSSAESQIQAFDDTWHWGENAEETYDLLCSSKNLAVKEMISAMRRFLGENQMMAYIVMMAARLVELHRVLKPTGSLYLHCDPTASHYLKLVLDTVFGVKNFRTEIIWKRSSAHNDTKQGRKQHGRIHDTILFYTKSEEWVWNPVFVDYGQEYIDSTYGKVDKKTGKRFKSSDLTAAKPGGDTSYDWNVKKKISTNDWEDDLTDEYLSPSDAYVYKAIKPTKGRYWAYSKQNMIAFAKENKIYHSANGVPYLKQYLDEMLGISLQDLWTDITPAGDSERLGYPTQKPLELLDRIILSSSNKGDTILDPFSGCGTAISAAQKLERHWIGIDITHLAIAAHKKRLFQHFLLEPGKDYSIIGEPTDLDGAKQLASEDRYQFQWWAGPLVGADPIGGLGDSKAGKKGSDKGIDGIITFFDDPSKIMKRVIVSIKSGHVNSSMIRDLIGVLDREKDAPIGVFITLEPPTPDMKKEAILAGHYVSELWGTKYPRCQILTIEQLLAGAKVNMPQVFSRNKKAERIKKADGSQPELDFD